TMANRIAPRNATTVPIAVMPAPGPMYAYASRSTITRQVTTIISTNRKRVTAFIVVPYLLLSEFYRAAQSHSSSRLFFTHVLADLGRKLFVIPRVRVGLRQRLGVIRGHAVF